MNPNFRENASQQSCNLARLVSRGDLKNVPLHLRQCDYACVSGDELGDAEEEGEGDG